MFMHENYYKFDNQDNRVSFKGIVIDAGHGGTDPGAISSAITEKDYTLRISQYMANRFRELGVPFAMTRNSDITLTPSDRIEAIKKPFGDTSDVILISNHLNAGGGEDINVVKLKEYDMYLFKNSILKLDKNNQNIYN